MLALIKLTLTLPGLSAPKISCVTLPIAPTGVVSVSPVTRQATSANQNDSATAMALSRPKCRSLRAQARQARRATRSGQRQTNSWAPRWPRRGQISCRRRAEGDDLPEIAECAECYAPGQRKTQQSCGDHAGRAEPERPLHKGGEAQTFNDALRLEDGHDHSPACIVPETSMVAQTRIPVMAPAARKMKSQEKTTVRPDQAS